MVGQAHPTSCHTRARVNLFEMYMRLCVTRVEKPPPHRAVRAPCFSAWRAEDVGEVGTKRRYGAMTTTVMFLEKKVTQQAVLALVAHFG